ncbi:Tex family protein [uncultured Adlercreutzia sp.]|uniref:Tex family protein n=1 Tax=uncultured Adlercreutzia sp. TaxID=875803 RepID=UPI0025F54DF1|nr:Tex family protein [uncultured Adlercreutzia sp.]MCI9262505.1 RNA-binding transcriptional accessory protein [Eggerthellaceae bacterium]
MDVSKVVAEELGMRPGQVAAVVSLLADGCTIPFIARYRKEATGGLDDVTLRALAERLDYLERLEARKTEVCAAIEEQGALTTALARQIAEAPTLQRVEDFYKPFKKSRVTRASKARDAGLSPLANALMAQGRTAVDPLREAARFAKPGTAYPDAAAALQGACDIVAETVADNPDALDELRGFVQRTGQLTSRAATEEAARDFAAYVDFGESLARIPSHRVLAVNRGEKEGKLRVAVAVDGDEATQRLERRFVRGRSAWLEWLQRTIADSWKRLMAPSLEREARAAATERAQKDAIAVFAKNAEALLRQRPVKGARIIALDPGYRTGCKVAVIDEYGALLDHGTIYPTPPRNQVAEAKRSLRQWADRYDANVIVVGNGTASRETEEVVADFIAEYPRPVEYTIVNEAGASVYSASELASQEHPDLDVTTRGALSLGRRLQDPLAELVKIPPQSIGVGQYQHDLDQKELARTLAGVVERVVNQVGADLNTASASLLGYVAGVTPTVARNIVAYREENGPFTSRAQLKKVPKLGPKAFQNCAGFLRIREGREPLDATGVHPESYAVAREVLKRGGVTSAEVAAGGVPDLRQRLGNLDALAQQLGVGLPTLTDIVAELEKPGRDPRDDAPAPVFSRAVLSLDDLEPGMELTGTVRNVVDFGAFVDIGVKQDGLVHISKLANRFVKHPTEVVSVGDTVTVWVDSIDRDRGRIALSMVKGK